VATWQTGQETFSLGEKPGTIEDKGQEKPSPTKKYGKRYWLNKSILLPRQKVLHFLK